MILPPLRSLVSQDWFGSPWMFSVLVRASRENTIHPGAPGNGEANDMLRAFREDQRKLLGATGG